MTLARVIGFPAILIAARFGAVYALKSTKVSKITTEKGKTGIIQAAFIGVLFTGFFSWSKAASHGPVSCC